ncbi:M55 family metallopeptidase [Ewingella americana]|jgi:D-amino peptidase|uniref:Aminopeptidase n=1 Tax=Ewingella americana TaxID=41202 RepID=A0A502GS32_9GAMM|nr:M55 family metallopeptidase [Ewingella americana]TPG64684.1 aminopeptidase [Ewingella americana]
MKIFISADIEGVAGVMRPEQCSPGNADYEAARALMEQEVNAAIDGAFAGGATTVTVADSHATMQNLRAENIDPRARLVQGKPRALSMIEGIAQQQYDGLMLVGFHTAAGESGVLAHTINGRAFYRVKLNGQVVGESDLYAAAAAELNVPLWLVTGDDQLERWINQHYPYAQFVCVKRAISANAAESDSPAIARAQIRKQATLAVTKAVPGITNRFASPYTLELMVTKPVLADIFMLIPGVERLDAVTVSYTSASVAPVISLLSAFSYLASTQK